MTSETQFIALLQAIASDPASRGLTDDTAVLHIGDETLVITHDMMVEGVHFRPDDPPGDVAWKLVAVNMSDLAAKGAQPIGVLLGFGLGTDNDWNGVFVTGLQQALSHYGASLLGGDTVSQPKNNGRALGLTAIGRSSLNEPPSRSGAKAGDALYVCGTIGDAWAGLALLERGDTQPCALISAYRRPQALVNQGVTLAPDVHAMMDVSDGLLIDASRMAKASGLHATIEIGAIPLSEAFIATIGEGPEERLSAATGGDDYALLFAAPPDLTLPVPATRIGRFETGSNLDLLQDGKAWPLPKKLGWLHQG